MFFSNYIHAKLKTATALFFCFSRMAKLVDQINGRSFYLNTGSRCWGNQEPGPWRISIHIPWTLACALSHVSPFAAVMFYWWVSQTKIDDATISSSPSASSSASASASLRRCEEHSRVALLFPLLPPANGENLFKTSTQLHPLTARSCNRRQRSWWREIDVVGIKYRHSRGNRGKSWNNSDIERGSFKCNEKWLSSYF